MSTSSSLISEVCSVKPLSKAATRSSRREVTLPTAAAEQLTTADFVIFVSEAKQQMPDQQLPPGSTMAAMNYESV